jgi:hypothetical protein
MADPFTIIYADRTGQHFTLRSDQRGAVSVDGTVPGPAAIDLLEAAVAVLAAEAAA